MSIVDKAWQILKVRIEEKNSWGKIEVKLLMLDCLSEAATGVDDEDKVRGR